MIEDVITHWEAEELGQQILSRLQGLEFGFIFTLAEGALIKYNRDMIYIDSWEGKPTNGTSR